MNITTRAQDFELTPAIDQFVCERLSTSLARFEQEVTVIDVFLKDTNGPRGGIDKQVLIRVSLRNRQQLALLTTHQDLYGAIRLGVRKTKRAVRRQTSKYRQVARQKLRDALPSSP